MPNLAAKPIIDIMVGVLNFDIAKECIDPLKTIEYEYVSQYEAERYVTDIMSYCDGKSEFIRKVVDLALLNNSINL